VVEQEYIVRTPYERMLAQQMNWDQVRAWYDNELNQLALPEDIDHNGIKRLDKAVDDLYRVFRKDYARIAERKNKVERHIKRVTTKASASLSGPSNETRRKAEGIRAAEEYKFEDSDQKVNLYRLEDQMNAYYEFFEYVKDVIERKSGALARALGTSKIESWLAR
jgi:hypothetical protein